MERSLADSEALNLREQRFATSLGAEATEEMQHAPERAELTASQPVSEPSDDNSPAHSYASPATESDPDAWRGEISERLSRFRARRKIRPPRYPSLNLQFGSIASAGTTEVPQSAPSPHPYEPASDRALALDGMRQEPSPVASTGVEPPPALAVETVPRPASPPAGQSGAKIIEFPRFAWGPPPPPPDQLAEPVGERPRILEAPEVAPPPPALGGITIDAPERQEAEKRPGIDIPLQSASLARRMFAAAIDGLIICVASALFGVIFWKVAAVRPPQMQILGLAAGISCLFWALYQYMLLVYAATTPGLRAVGLQLARFDGTSTNRSLRRWRVLGSYLSAASLGMGYVWVFLDEDALCWHDRITHTYLAPGKPHSKPEELTWLKAPPTGN